MEINAITGLYPYSPLTGINGMNGVLASRADENYYKKNKYKLAAPRQAFIWLVKANLWGIASIAAGGFSRSGTIKQFWKNAWYNLGGNPDKLIAAINKGKYRKTLLPKTAPSGLQDFLKRKGLAGTRKPGIGGAGIDTGTTPSAGTSVADIANIIKTAGEIILQILDLLKNTTDALPPGFNIPPATEDPPKEDPPKFDDDTNFSLDQNTILLLALGAFLLLRK